MADTQKGAEAYKTVKDFRTWAIAALATLVVYQSNDRLSHLEESTADRFTAEDFKRERLLLLAEMSANKREAASKFDRVAETLSRVEESIDSRYSFIETQLARQIKEQKEHENSSNLIHQELILGLRSIKSEHGSKNEKIPNHP